MSQDAKEIFFQAAEISEPQQRAEFLDGACENNPQLRKRVNALLQAHDEPGSFMQEPAPVASATMRQPESFTEKPGTMIGPYKIATANWRRWVRHCLHGRTNRTDAPQGCVEDYQAGNGHQRCHRAVRSRTTGTRINGPPQHCACSRCRCDRYKTTLLCDGTRQGSAFNSVL